MSAHWIDGMNRTRRQFVGVAGAFTIACSAGSGGSNAVGTGGAANVAGSSVAGGVSGETGSGTASGTSGSGQDPLGCVGTPTIMIDPPNRSVMPTDSCASAAFESHLLPSSLLFLIDRSGSMNCNLPPVTDSTSCEQNPVAEDVNQPTKWSVIAGGLSKAFDELSSIPGASAGLTFFSNDDVCGVIATPNVPLEPLQKPQIDALTNALMNAKPSGGTPIVGAVILGYKHLHQQALARGNRFVILVTDGSDSCLDKYAAQGVTGDVVYRLLDMEIPKAVSVNIRTFVIGAPGSEPARGLLSKIAYLGGSAQDASCDHTSDNPAPGMACHFDMTQTTDFAKDLGNTLQKVTSGTALTCDFDVPMPSQDVAVDPDLVNVDYYKSGDMTSEAAHVPLYRDDTKPCDTGAAGWQYIENKTKIRICGMVCDQVRADPTAKVIVSLGCPPRVIR